MTAARDIMTSSVSWKRGKSFHKNKVHTFSKPKGPGDGASWHGRVSEHGPEDATFDEFWSKLGQNHPENEMQCVYLTPVVLSRFSLSVSTHKVYQGSKEGDLSQADLTGTGDMDHALRVPSSCLSSRLHRRPNGTCRQNIPKNRVST